MEAITDDYGLLYPNKLTRQGYDTHAESEAVKAALKNGMDPNILWAEKDLVDPRPKSGCVVPCYIYDSRTWPHYNTPLHRALHFSDSTTAEILLQHGADINLYNAVGQTPLHEAVWNREHDIIRFLLANNADINKVTVGACVRYEDDNRDICNVGGEHNIQRAISCSDLTSLMLLVEAGADLRPGSQYPWSALDLALLSGDRRIAEYLLTRNLELPVKDLSQDDPSEEDQTQFHDLLLFTRGREIVPRKELYDAYYFILAKIRHQNAQVEADILIQQFTEALHEATGEAREDINSKKCASCRLFQIEAACIYETRAPFEFALHQSRQDLYDSAKSGCRLCCLLADTLDRGERRDNHTQKNANNVPPKLEPAPENPVLLSTGLFISETGSVHLWSLTVSHGDLRVSLDLKSTDEYLARFFEDNEDPDSSTGSARAMSLSKRWLHTCRVGAEHIECQEANDNQQKKKTLPRRLVQVGAPNSVPRIVEVQDIHVPYCVLSYCSGSKDLFTTTRGNLQRRMAGIPPDTLPVLMQDAVHVTRSLGFEHLWIDALCIVQDDVDDRTHEAAVMDAIYSNAELTISALVAGDCHTSLFTPRSGRIILPVPLHIWKPKCQRIPHISRVVCTHWLQTDLDLPDSVLSQGWTFQEQLLSKRVLHFGDGILHWECLHHYTIEADPGGDDGRIWRNRIKRHDTKLAIHAPASIGANPESEPKRFYQEPFEIWKEQVQEFTKRDPENPHDKLPVIAAVSARLAAGAGSSILCGLWNGEQLLESLCWNVVEPSSIPPTTTPNMPSWTWVAAIGEISFELTKRPGREGVEIRPGPTIVSIDTPNSEPAAQGCRSITLRSNLYKKRPAPSSLFTDESKLDTEGFHTRHLFDADRSVYLDHIVDMNDDIYTFEICCFPPGPPYEWYGYPRWRNGRSSTTIRMLMQRAEGGPNLFRRIGVGVVPGEFIHLPEELDDESGDENEEEYLPFTWLVIDQDVLHDQVFSLI